MMAGAEAETVILGGCEGGDFDDRKQIEMMAESSQECDDRPGALSASTATRSSVLPPYSWNAGRYRQTRSTS